jgi:succinoglycan biosynthesis transport protein ExoP
MIPQTPESFPAAPRVVAAPPDATEAGLSDLFVTLRKRKWIIFAMALVGFLYGLYTFRTQPHVFVASGTIEIHSGSSNAFRVNAEGGSSIGSSDASSAIPTQLAILKSDSLLLSVARDLDLANNPYFMGSKGPTHLSIDEPAVRQRVIGALNSDLNPVTVPKTDIIRISCTTLNPKLSADIINKLVIDYIHRSMQTRFDATKRASDFLSGQLSDLKAQVEDSQSKVIDLGKRIGVLGFDPSHNQITTNLDTLTKAVGEAEVERILAESRYKVLSNMDPTALDNSVDAGGKSSTGQSAIAGLRGQRDAVKVQMAQLATRYGPKYPQMQGLEAEDQALGKQIEEEERRLLTQAKQDYVATDTAENQVRGALEAEKTNAYKLRDDLVDYTLEQREYESSRTLYDSLVERLRTAGIQAGLESTEIDIVDPAVPPVGPTLKSRSNMLTIDVTTMLVLGIILAFILENLDTGIQSVTELETITGLPSLALIPRARRPTDSASLSVAQRNITTLASPKSQFAESFRALRTSLLLSTPGGEPKVILLTSGTPSEGKTTAAINLATVLAQRGVRVLLIDTDLRRPTIHHRFGLNGKIGLTSVLAGGSTLSEAIQSFPEIPNLDILVSGPIPPFPTEMLSSDAMHRLVEEVRGTYTHVVMDSPPLLSVTDSVVLASGADAVIMVVRHGKSTKHTVRRSHELLSRAGAHTIGIVFNAVDVNSPEYYAYYGYSGYSGYTSAGGDSPTWDTEESRADANKEDSSR